MKCGETGSCASVNFYPNSLFIQGTSVEERSASRGEVDSKQGIRAGTAANTSDISMICCGCGLCLACSHSREHTQGMRMPLWHLLGCQERSCQVFPLGKRGFVATGAASMARQNVGLNLERALIVSRKSTSATRNSPLETLWVELQSTPDRLGKPNCNLHCQTDDSFLGPNGRRFGVWCLTRERWRRRCHFVSLGSGRMISPRLPSTMTHFPLGSDVMA